MIMVKVNWDLFKVKNENYRQAFEDLCFHLFCRKVNIIDSIRADFNQVGIETEPVQHNSKYWGFQAKFFDSSIDYQQIKKSVELALSRYQNLDTIIIYTNKQPTSSSKGYKTIDDAAKKADKTIEWIAPRDFDLLLTRPGNHDLGRLYFNFSNEYGFITNIKKNSLIQSNSYIELSFEDEHNEKVEEFSQKLLTSTQKITLISGAPGSGKSVFMYKLFFDYAGLGASNKEEMQQIWVKNGAFPILIDLKECNYQPLELIVRNILKDYNLESQKIIYLLDGLDELSDRALHNAQNHIDKLVHFENTLKIIVSSRINSFNRTKFKSIFSACLEYHIAPLTMNEISAYFESKQDGCKIELLKEVPDIFLKEIQEIVLLSLLWENIEQLTEQSSIIDLFDLHINHILDNSRHCKVLNTLNLPSPQKDAIIKINKEIAQAMYVNKSLEIGYETLHSLIEKMFPRCSYKDINEIANYISDCFFDNISSNVNNSHFTYMHRRYQEYFFVLKIKELFEIDPKVIRDFRIAGDRDLFQGIFLKHIHKDYTNKQNIRGILDYSILKLYLGLSDSWGADEAYHRNSSPFLPALLSQNDDVFESLLKDPNIDFDTSFIIELEDIRENIDIWKKHQSGNKRHFESEQYLRDVWDHHIPRVISQQAYCTSTVNTV